MAARHLVGRFARCERGATAVEYSLICALVFVVVCGSITAFGNKTTAMFDRISATIAAAIGS